MRRSVALSIGIVAAFLALALLVSQLALPPLASRRIEHRLTRDGGGAHVSLHAFPALRLLFHKGDEIDVTGSGLRVDLGAGKQKVFQNLDGFGAVHIHLSEVSAGPFVTHEFSLDRDHGSPTYQLTVQASFTPSTLASYLGSSVGGSLGALFGGIAGGLVPGGSVPVPVNVEARLETDHGSARVVSGAGSVAGVPMGPILEAVAAAVVARL
jgi:LmeA-like phospholipid-binding